MVRPRPALPQQPSAPSLEASSQNDYLRSVPPEPYQPEPYQPEPSPPERAASQSNAPAANDRLAPLQQPTSVAPSRAPLAAPPKKRGLQVAVIVVLLLLVAVFVAALTMLKR